MKVLVVGSGGREHALVWKLASSSRVKKLYSAPGNPGIAQLAERVEIPQDAVPRLLEFAKSKSIDLTVVGPEAPLAGGIVDLFEKEGLAVFGPRKEPAKLEWSKVFAKEFMHRYHIPTSSYGTYADIESASLFARTASYPIVIKASGLAAGKGAVVVHDREEASETLRQMFVEQKFGEAGSEVVVEDYLSGREISLISFCDGKTIKPMLVAQDHKRLLDGDEGPNTGGMGAYAPVLFFDDNLMSICRDRILQPTLEGLKKEGLEYKGVLYAGLMLTQSGPKVLEFNCRFGDPEAQAIIPLLETDLVEICEAVNSGKLDKLDIKWKEASATCVVLAAGGYPGEYERGKEIRGLKDIAEEEGLVFHAGTRMDRDRLVTSGGRVLGVTAMAKTLEESIEKAYRLVDKIHFEGMQYRQDIGRKGVD